VKEGAARNMHFDGSSRSPRVSHDSICKRATDCRAVLRKMTCQNLPVLAAGFSSGVASFLFQRVLSALFV